MNKIIISGRLTKDVEERSLGDGTHTSSFSIANNEGYGDKQKTNFINVVAFGNTADFIAKYFKKGNQILIEGRLSVSNYEDKEGNKKNFTDVVVEKVEFMGNKENSGASENKSNDPLDDFNGKELTLEDDDELPF